MRQLLCRQCGERYELPDDDTSRGLKIRKVYLTTIVPKGHGVTTNGFFAPMDDLHCDICNEVITGKVCVAVTVWKGTEPRHWESEYGTILPSPVVAVIDTLTKTENEH